MHYPIFVRAVLAASFSLLFSIQPLSSKSQDFKLLRYEEEGWGTRDSCNRLSGALKSWSFNKDKQSNMTLGGEIRYDFGGKIDEDWISNQGFNYSILQRYSLHSAIHFGPSFRLFLQLNSALESGSKFGPTASDEDKLNVQNMFAEYRLSTDSNMRFAIRLGRQELNYGSGRLISVRDGNNTRQYFTGAKLLYKVRTLTTDIFFLKEDERNFGVLDNLSSNKNKLWGCYSSLYLQNDECLDVYYAGISRQQARFEIGLGHEIRHTIGMRYWRNNKGLIFNLEAAYQIGSFQNSKISAWTAAIELSYTLDEWPFKPTFTLKNDYISGNQNLNDGILQTFNPLYPRGGYFGLNPMVGPANLVDFHPVVSIQFDDRLSLQMEVTLNWRFSIQDGLYRPSGSFNLSASGSPNRHIGTAYLLSSGYELNKNFGIGCGLQYFQIGRFLKDCIPLWSNSKYFNAQFSFRF